MSGICGDRKTDGDRCQVDFGLCDQCGLCYHHCTHREEARAESRRRGGAATARKFQGASLSPDDLPALTSHEAAEQWTDAIGRAAATGGIGASAANAALRAVREWREARDSGRVAERLEALEKAMGAWRRTGDPALVLDLVDSWRTGQPLRLADGGSDG